MELQDNGKQLKVTRRIYDLGIAETKLFKSKEEAMQPFNEWLQ